MELENFRDAVLARPADIVTLRQGIETVEVAAAILAASGTVTRSACRLSRDADPPAPAMDGVAT